jgi:hypothetical protein
VQISLLVKQFSVWVFSSVYIQIVVVYLAFSFQLRAVYRLGFSVDTGDRSEQGYTHVLGAAQWIRHRVYEFFATSLGG